MLEAQRVFFPGWGISKVRARKKRFSRMNPVVDKIPGVKNEEEHLLF
jgi:hypothetical protein